MLESNAYLEKLFKKHCSVHTRYEIVELNILARANLSGIVASAKELAFVPLHPKKIEHNAEALWKQWQLRNTRVAHKQQRRSKLDSAFNRKLAVGDVADHEDTNVDVRVYTDLHYALHGMPKGTYLYVGYYLPDQLVPAYDLPKTSFLVEGSFVGAVLLKVL